MCVWILSLWIEFHFVFFVVSMVSKNSIVKSHLSYENKNKSHVNIEASMHQDHEKFHSAVQSEKNFEKITKQNFIKVLKRTITDISEKNALDKFPVINNETKEESAHLTSSTKLSFNILGLNNKSQDYTKYGRNVNMIHKIDLFSHNNSQTQRSITPYHTVRNNKKLDSDRVITKNKNKTTKTYERDYRNSWNTYKGTKENRVKYDGKEYVISETDNNAIVRAMIPKIERYKLGSFHFSHEIKFINTGKIKNPKKYTAIIFDSHEGFTTNQFIFKQNNIVDDVNYKLPEEAFETDTIPMEKLLTSTVVHSTTRTKKITDSPYRTEMHKERILMKMGPFTYFVYKLMELLAKMRPTRLTKELTDQLLDVTLELYRVTPNLVEFGEAFKQGIIDFFTTIRTYEADTLQRMALIFHKALPKRWELLHVLVNVIYERIDQMFIQSEVDKLYNLLEDLKNYPNITKNSTQFAQSILVDAIVIPFTREGRTQRRLEMLARLNAYISFSFYDGQYLIVPGLNEDEESSTSGFTYTLPEGLDISTRNITTEDDLETNNVTQDFEKTSMATVTEVLKATRMATVTESLEASSGTTVPSTELTKPVGRLRTKNKAELLSDAEYISDEKIITKKTVFNGLTEAEKPQFYEDDILSLYKNYFSNHEVHEPSKNCSNLQLSSDYAKTKRNSNEINRKDKGRQIKGNKKKSTPGKRSSKVKTPKIRKKLLSTDKGLIKKGSSKKKTKKYTKITKLTSTPKLKAKVFNNKTKSFVSVFSQSGLIAKNISQNILRNKDENYDDVNNLIKTNSVKQNQTKSTDSFLDLLLKLDALVNSGERGLLDEILHSDEQVRDSTFKKIDSENEKFLEKEAAAKKSRKIPKFYTKEHMLNKSENTVKTKRLHYSKHETKKYTKKHLQDNFQNSDKNTELQFSKFHEKTKSVKERVRHKLKKASGKYNKTKEFTVTKHKLYISNKTRSHKSRKITNSRPFIKLNLKAVIPQITRKLSTEYKNDHITKKVLRGLKIDHTTMKSSVKKPKGYYDTNKTLKALKKESKTTSRLKKNTKEHIKQKLLKKYQKAYLGGKTTKFHTILKPGKEPAKHNRSSKTSKETKKLSEQNKLNSVVKKKTIQRYFKSDVQTEIKLKEELENTKTHHNIIQPKHHLQKHQGPKLNQRVKEETQEDYDYLSDSRKKTLKNKDTSYVEDTSTYQKEVATRYRPSKRINEEFLRQKHEKVKKRKLKHSKIYRPLERIADKGKQSKKKHMRKQLRNLQPKSREKSVEETGDKKSEDNAIIDEDLDDSAMWEPNPMERAVKQNSDDYYIIQGGGMSKIIFQNSEKSYEIKKSNKRPFSENKNMPRQGVKQKSFSLSEKENYSVISKKLTKSDYNLRKRNKNNIATKYIRKNLKQRETYKENSKQEKQNSRELTDLLEEILEHNSSEKAVFKNVDDKYEDDFYAPINEYTLKPIHKVNTEKSVFTTKDIFRELKQLKNRLFHQNFRRDMNRKHKITFKELFLKEKSRLNKILEESSYSDEENDLKAKLKDALFRGRDARNETLNNSKSNNKIENMN